MVFRKESRHDSFQRQISALRQQLSADQDGDAGDDDATAPPLRFTRAPDEQSEEDAPAPMPTEVQTAGGDTGVIAVGSSWSGMLRSEGSVHIYGTVDGEIDADEDVFVAEGATVDARVSATNVIVAGRLGGSIECRNRLEVWPSGRVTGDISSPSLVVHEGATMDGKVTMRTPDDSG